MYHTDDYRFVNPDSLYVFNVKTIDTSYNRETRFYHEIQNGFRDENDVFIDKFEATLLDQRLVVDTQFIYSSNYNLLYGIWEFLPNENNIFKTTFAWQHREWDLL